MKTYRKGPIGAIIDELEVAIEDFKSTLKKVSESDFSKVVDTKTRNPSCRSIETIVDHVIRCGYYYPTMVLRNKFPNEEFLLPSTKNLKTKSDYFKALDEMLVFNEDSMKRIKPSEIFQLDAAKKINTGWALYDYEQIMEHGIVHIYRHRRQIKQYIEKLKEI